MPVPTTQDDEFDDDEGQLVTFADMQWFAGHVGNVTVTHHYGMSDLPPSSEVDSDGDDVVGEIDPPMFGAQYDDDD